MKFTLLRLPRVRRSLSRETLWNTVWIAALFGLELFGRWSPSDTTDFAGVAVLTTLALVTWREHTARPLPLVARIVEWFARQREALSELRFDTGIDLRGEPPLPRAIPRAIPYVAGGALLAAALLALNVHAFPTTARDVVSRFSAAAYLVVVTALWAFLIGGTVTGLALPILLAREAIRHSLRWSERRAGELGVLATLSYFAVIGLGATWLPNWVPLALLIAGLAASTTLALIAREPRLDVIWKASGNVPHARPFAMAWTTQALAQAWIFGGVAIALVLLTRGDRLVGDGSAETTITALLGHAFAWASTGVFTVLALDLGMAVHVARRRNPAAPIPTRVRILNELSVPERRGVNERLGEAGFRIAFSDDPHGPADVTLIVKPVEFFAAEEQTDWPLTVPLQELDAPGLHERLRRRDEIVRRRRLFSGLERLFKACPRSKFERGSGAWLAPHLWFITRMSRDVEEEDELLSGPPYHPTLALEARAHLHEVLKAVEIDILFVEDGVGFRRLQRVLRTLFEYYDMFGGKRRAEERQFVGTPGVRVMIHEYDLERPFHSEVYPEPDYEDLGRARILHVFRDRGDDVLDPLNPIDADLLPVPQGFPWAGSPVGWPAPGWPSSV